MAEILTEREVLVEVLALYKDFPCLWNTSHNLYCNRDARNQALEILRDCYSRFDRSITVNDVKKKIENMRAAYRRERKKVEMSKSSGAGTEDIYTPSLWYYQYFTFLHEKQNPAVQGVDNFVDCNSDNESIEPEKKKTRNSNKRQANEIFQKQVQLLDTANTLLNDSGEESSADTFGRSVSSQLKEISNNLQCCLAEKLIGEILFYAKLSQLNMNTVINLYSPHSQSLLHRVQTPNSLSHSHSPLHQVQSPHSHSPLHQVQSPQSLSHSHSPLHQVQSPQSLSHSQSLLHRVQSPQSLSHSHSPLHQVQSPHSHSPLHRVQSPQSLSHSHSPLHQVQSPQSLSHSHSPLHQVQSPHSHSPLHQVQSPHSLSHSQTSQVQSLDFNLDLTNESIDTTDTYVVRGECKDLKDFLIFKKPH